MNHVESGLDRFLANPPEVAIGARLGLLTNPSGIDHHFRSSIDLILEHPRLKLAALFGPFAARADILELDESDPNVPMFPHVSLNAVWSCTALMASTERIRHPFTYR